VLWGIQPEDLHEIQSWITNKLPEQPFPATHIIKTTEVIRLCQLSVALEEQRKVFTAQIENLKAEITASIAIQLSNAYIPAPVSSGSYAAAAQSLSLGTPPPRSPPLSQPSNLASISMSQGSAISETIYCTIDAQELMKASRARFSRELSEQRLRRRFVQKEGNNWSARSDEGP